MTNTATEKCEGEAGIYLKSKGKENIKSGEKNG
jgi:hypothetical protein